MSLKDKVKVALNRSGFEFARASTVHYSTLPDFQKALKSQEQATALLDSQIVTDLDIDGNLLGTEEPGMEPLRLSRDAFSDLCRLSKIGESFAKRRATLNENLTLALMRDCISHEFRDGDFRLVVNTEHRRVEGIVESKGYAHLPNAKALEYAMSTQESLTLSQAWIEGADTRFALLNKNRPTEVRKGDIVHFGVNVGSSLAKNGMFAVTDYNERLVCTNGMLRRQEGMVARIPHSGDVRFNLQRAILTSHDRSGGLGAKMKTASTQLLTAANIRTLRQYLEDPKFGGSPSLSAKVTKAAMREATAEGRSEEEPTHWNFVNAVTAEAHETASMTKRESLEALGFSILSAI